MTEVEKKWFESLKRCLSKKPDSLEVLVHENFCNANGIGSDIYLFKKGELFQVIADADDLMVFDPSETAIAKIKAPDWSGNNHGY